MPSGSTKYSELRSRWWSAPDGHRLRNSGGLSLLRVEPEVLPCLVGGRALRYVVEHPRIDRPRRQPARRAEIPEMLAAESGIRPRLRDAILDGLLAERREPRLARVLAGGFERLDLLLAEMPRHRAARENADDNRKYRQVQAPHR